MTHFSFKFRYFSGLLSQERKADNTTKKPEPAYDDDDVDPAIDEMVPEAPANEKLDLFVKDMELSIKVFLGQWLQDNGQHVYVNASGLYHEWLNISLDGLAISKHTPGWYTFSSILSNALASSKIKKRRIWIAH
jgi:hypothetical protein